jgi:hypothetical protein
MFYYYGRKEKLYKHYSKPIYDTIIEPFAGSAVYALKNFDKNVYLIEKDEKIIAIWNYLMSASQKDILSLPLLIKGQSLKDDEFKNLTEIEKDLISFFTNPSSAQAKRSVGKFNIWHEKNRKRLSEDCQKIKHWKIIHGDYTTAPDLNATWFIDPPYQGNGGKYYRYGNSGINYSNLKEWVENRKGQVIVCENSEANWMDFRPLVRLQGQRKKTFEVVYENSFKKKVEQIKLF